MESEENKKIKFAIAGAVVFLVFVVITLVIVFTAQPNGTGNVSYTHGYRSAAVAADTNMCSTVGKDILLKGGNAVDAAIAALICTGLGSPQSMGIGGGFFMNIYNRTTGQSSIIDAREIAPKGATDDMFANNTAASAIGGLSVAVPGEIKGYWYAHQKYGILPWPDLFQPSIKLAMEGFPVPPGLHIALAQGERFIKDEPSLRAVFWNEKTGAIHKKGEIIQMQKLGQTLKAIADGGEVTFYAGTLAGDILQDLTEIGSVITAEDLLNYTVKEKVPVEITLSNGMKVISPPAPSGGPVLSFILNVLDGFSFTPNDIASVEDRIKTYHKFIETFKYAYAKRTALGDDDFIDIKDVLQNLTSRDYADSIRYLINESQTHEYEHYGGTYFSKAKTSTSHLAVLDEDGNAVSVTSTVNARFGSRRIGKRTGIVFNDEMDDFSTPNITNEWGIYPSPANFIEPGKRPLSSMCPAIFVDKSGKVSKILGGAGGSMITSSTAWVAAHILWLGDSIDSAVNRRRLHHQLLPPALQYEEGFEDAVVQGLTGLGHSVNKFAQGRSIIHGINVDDGVIHAKCDERKGGLPDGY